jgi:hypothetical protein
MEALAAKAGATFDIHVVYGADHFSVLAPLTRLVAHKIVEDTGPVCAIRITDDEVRDAFASRAPTKAAP